MGGRQCDGRSVLYIMSRSCDYLCMASLTDAMTSSEAARELGVGVRQVERLVAAGSITRVGTVGRAALIDPASVHRLRTRGVRRGRPWTAATSLAAIDLLTIGRTDRLGQVERSRLISRLRGMTAEDVVRATQGRARARRYRASASFLDRIRTAATLTGTSAIDADRAVAGQFGLSSSTRDMADAYVDRRTAEQLIARCHLVEDARGNVTLRATEALHEGGTIAPVIVVALDLADSLDVRERAAGITLLQNRLEGLG